ncbi:MAG: ABC transporter ATP-binding protein [Beijerinckiaceae bacterium]|nr:ABC transporter ATP-binding protein [Beijerinckiaceae bacterium]
MSSVLEVDELSVSFAGEDGRMTTVVDKVSFKIGTGRTLGIVGESGCGKSVTSLAIMGLLDPASASVSGTVTFEGIDLRRESESRLRDLRGDRMAMIFQEPMTSLNPSHTVGAQIVEAIQRHRALSRKDAEARALEALRQVSIPSPETRFHDYPHRLSGGMRQRVMIAMALSCDPKLVIADEPTTALDVTIQAQILDLLRRLRDDTGAAIMLITHDLGVVAEVCEDVLVMYAGEVVERASVGTLFRAPQHPYTVGLMGAIPRMAERKPRLATIEGSVPNMRALPAGCRFSPRCPFADAQCRTMPPPIREVEAGHTTRCWKAPLESLVA